MIAIRSKMRTVGIVAVFFFGYVSLVLITALVLPSPVLATAVADLIVSIAVILYRKRCTSFVDRAPITMKSWLIGLCFLVCIWFVSQIDAAVIFEFGDDVFSTYSDMVSSMPVYAMVALSCIVAPIAEEMLFRGAIYASMRRSFGVMVSAIVSAASFAIIHMTVVHIPMALMLGLFLCVVYERTQSAWSCALVHGVYNTMTLCLSGVSLPMILVEPLIAAPMFVFMIGSLFALLVSMSRERASA